MVVCGPKETTQNLTLQWALDSAEACKLFGTFVIEKKS